MIGTQRSAGRSVNLLHGLTTLTTPKKHFRQRPCCCQAPRKRLLMAMTLTAPCSLSFLHPYDRRASTGFVGNNRK